MKILFNLLVLVLALQPAAAGGNPGSGFEPGTDKEKNRPAMGDQYLSGGTVRVKEPIRGDLVAAGGILTVNGPVSGDALLAGGNMIINAPIGDDLRAAGGAIQLNHPVSGDVVVAGGEILINARATVQGNLLVTGGKVVVNSIIMGQVKMYGGELILNGQARENLVAKGGKLVINGAVQGPSQLAAESITLGPRARFHSHVSYWQKAGPLDFYAAMANGKATYQPELGRGLNTSRWYYLGFSSLLTLFTYISSALLMMFLLQLVFPRKLANAGALLNENLSGQVGYGLLYLFGLPVIGFFLITTVIGIPIGLFLLFFYLFTVLAGQIITSLVMANWYNKKHERHWHRTGIIAAALAFLLGLTLISLIPVVGWLFTFICILLTFGAIILSQKRKVAPRVGQPA